MAKLYDTITDELQAFIRQQPLFFVATAPLSERGHVNLSPKGLDCLRLLSAQQVAYLDLTGSGNETSAHLLENKRITFMFCAFEGAPRILRLYGRGHAVLPAQPEWPDLFRQFRRYPGARQIIVADITRVQTSCGFALPLFDYRGQRDTLLKWADSKGDQDLQTYRRQKNSASIDALPTPLSQELRVVTSSQTA